VKGDTPTPSKEGNPAPSFQLKDKTGNIRTLAEFHGKKIDVIKRAEEVLQTFSSYSKN
jgi:peroxiredoxin